MNRSIRATVKLLENFTIAAWIIDAEQNILYMNQTMREMFGDLSGQQKSVIYDNGNFEIASGSKNESDGVSEVVIADIPFRRLSSEVDLEADGKYRVEFFEDISEQKLIHTNMTRALMKIKAETKMAQTLQRNILPIDDTYWNTIAYSSICIPADDLCGDFYDLLKLNEDEFLFYMADVSGHGIQASLLTIFMRERVRTNMETALAGTGELLSKLVQDFIALGVDGTLYITMALCKYTKSRHELSISNAGHNCYPLIVRGNGRTETIPIRGVPICAIAGDLDYEEEIISMNPGDRLILFTDGIVEEVDSRTGRAFGSDGVRKLAEKYHAHGGGYLARLIMDESTRYALISAKDDRSIVIADILS